MDHHRRATATAAIGPRVLGHVGLVRDLKNYRLGDLRERPRPTQPVELLRAVRRAASRDHVAERTDHLELAAAGLMLLTGRLAGVALIAMGAVALRLG